MLSGLSPDLQHTMFRLLKESLADQAAMKQRMENLVSQNRTLEVHFVEVKSVLQVQQEIPAQVLLNRPVVLIDAFEGNRLPFHLESIDSFAALYAVFMVKSKDR